MKRLAISTLLVALLAAAGCHSMRFEVKSGPVAGTVEERNYYYLFALVPTRKIDVREKCPNGVASIYEEMTFVDGLIELFTIGIVSGRTTTYRCLAAPAEITGQP